MDFLGAGGGKIVVQTQNTVGTDYRQDFTEPFAAGETVEITATADDGSVFSGWDGGCTGDTGVPTCELVMDGNKTVRATFDRVSAASFDLVVTTTGNGMVSSVPAGISCGILTGRQCSVGW